MSFLSVIGKIGRVAQVALGVEQQAAPLINLIPGGGVVTTVASSIISLEHLFPQSGLGSSKAVLAQAAAVDAVPGINPDAVSAAIAKIVGGFNDLAAAAAAAIAAQHSPPSQ